MNKDKLYQWFLEHNLKSIGPHTSMFLLDIMKELRPRIISVQDDELRKELEDYENALITVCYVAAIHQKAVIDKLEKLVRGRSSDG